MNANGAQAAADLIKDRRRNEGTLGQVRPADEERAS